MHLCFFTRRRRFDVARKQPSETLDENDVGDASGTLGQAGNAETPHPEDVVQHDACKDVEEDVDEPDPEIPPALAVVDVAGREELVC